MNWNRQHIEKLKAEGKIRGYDMQTPKEKEPATGGRIVGKHFSRKSKGLDFISSNLLWWCNQNCLSLQEEYKFHPERKWRFDFAVPSLMLAVEFEGGVWDRNGSHTSVKDINRDQQKYNAAAIMGWKVLKFNATNYEGLLTEVNNLISPQTIDKVPGGVKKRNDVPGVFNFRK